MIIIIFIFFFFFYILYRWNVLECRWRPEEKLLLLFIIIIFSSFNFYIELIEEHLPVNILMFPFIRFIPFFIIFIMLFSLCILIFLFSSFLLEKLSSPYKGNGLWRPLYFGGTKNRFGDLFPFIFSKNHPPLCFLKLVQGRFPVYFWL